MKILIKKYLSLLLVLLLLSPMTALAAWTDDFLATAKQHGIKNAVQQALEKDITPDAILEFSLETEGVSETETIKALYCAGVDPDTVRDAAIELDIPEETLSEELEKSFVECQSVMVLDDRKNSDTSPASPYKP